MTSFSRVIDYDPAELVLTVQPDAPLADIEALLAAQNQMLAFEPYDFAEVTGGEAGRSTIGGVVGAALAGSRRLSAGGVRDHVLGFSAVNGRGEAFKAGGKVVKNVTGYDLSKLMTGSWGQLAALTEVTLKVLPRPHEVRTVALQGLDAREAVMAMGQAMRAKADVAAAAHAWINGKAMTALRVEGFGPSVAVRVSMLASLLGGKAEVLGDGEANTFWQTCRSARLGGGASGALLWRFVVPPSAGADIAAVAASVGGEAIMDWAGGLVWVRVPATVSGLQMRAAAGAAGGHAMLIGAPEDYWRETPALHPEPKPVAELSARVKASFDPMGVFQRFGAA